MNSAVTALRSLAHLLGLGQDADDLCVEVCYSVHVASVGTVIPAAHTVGFYVKRLVGIRKKNAFISRGSIRRANSDQVCLHVLLKATFLVL